MIRVRGGSGLGDSIYMRPIVDHVVASGRPAMVYSNFADVFIGSGARVEPFNRLRTEVIAHYTGGKSNPLTTQWDDVCRCAGMGWMPFEFPWTVRNGRLIDRMREAAAGRPIVLVHGGREPMGRRDGFGRELLPVREAFVAALEAFDDCLLVGIGKAEPLYSLPVHQDLNGGTSVSDLMDLASDCDYVVGQCSFAVPLAEAFDKPFLGIWSAVGLASTTPFIRQITPNKVLSKPTSRHVIDDWRHVTIKEAARAFRDL